MQVYPKHKQNDYTSKLVHAYHFHDNHAPSLTWVHLVEIFTWIFSASANQNQGSVIYKISILWTFPIMHNNGPNDLESFTMSSGTCILFPCHHV